VRRENRHAAPAPAQKFGSFLYEPVTIFSITEQIQLIDYSVWKTQSQEVSKFQREKGVGPG
jgi:hypothetical protein